MKSDNPEPALNPELAEKDAHKLQESYETTLQGEDEDENGDDEGEEGDDSVGDDNNNDRDPARLVADNLMDVNGPGLLSNTC